MVDGVCGGIAEYFDIDLTLVRLAGCCSVLWAAAAFWLTSLPLSSFPADRNIAIEIKQ